MYLRESKAFDNSDMEDLSYVQMNWLRRPYHRPLSGPTRLLVRWYVIAQPLIIAGLLLSLIGVPYSGSEVALVALDCALISWLLLRAVPAVRVMITATKPSLAERRQASKVMKQGIGIFGSLSLLEAFIIDNLSNLILLGAALLVLIILAHFTFCLWVSFLDDHAQLQKIVLILVVILVLQVMR